MQNTNTARDVNPHTGKPYTLIDANRMRRSALDTQARCYHDNILAAEGDSQWTFFDGNYQEYEADKKKRLGDEGARPHRMRFKALK